MKLLRNIIMAILFLAGVFLASANTELVELVYIPPSLADASGEDGVVQVPLFVVVLASVLAGVLLTGLGVFFEQLRLRMTARSLRRENKELQREVGTLTGRVEEMKAAERIVSPTWRGDDDSAQVDSDDDDEESGSVLGATGREDR